jgi:hypothetical protein
MDDADLLRNRSTRLFALAAELRQKGLSDYADRLEALGREAVRHAVRIEGRSHTGGIISAVKTAAKERAHF